MGIYFGQALHLLRHLVDEGSFAARRPGAPPYKAVVYAPSTPVPDDGIEKCLSQPNSNVGQGDVESSDCTLLPSRKFGLLCPTSCARSCRVRPVVLVVFNSTAHRPRQSLLSSKLGLPFVDPPHASRILLTLLHRKIALGGTQGYT